MSCAIPDCNVTIARTMLMCRSHWFMVPKWMRAKIWLEYKQGMGKKYWDIRDDAIAYVVANI